MKKILFLFLIIAGCSAVSFAQIKLGGRTIDTKKLTNAAADAAKAVTLSDKDIADMSREAVVWMDKNNKVSDPESGYSKRLARLTEKLGEVEGMALNYKVYEVTDINAFACGDGSIRVFSSLMDIMSDDELVAIIGHEIGHVVHTDVKDAMKNAYMMSAAKNAAGSAGGVAEKLTSSQLGSLVEAFTGAQFSQKQESQADDYAFEFCVKNGFDPYGMSNALGKLVELSNGEKASAVQRMFSTHPDSEKRSARMKEKADAHMNK